MAKLSREASSTAQRIFENIIFLEEVFISKPDEEIPDIHFLELARSLELKRRDDPPATMHGDSKRSRTG